MKVTRAVGGDSLPTPEEKQRLVDEWDRSRGVRAPKHQPGATKPTHDRGKARADRAQQRKSRRTNR